MAGKRVIEVQVVGDADSLKRALRGARGDVTAFGKAADSSGAKVKKFAGGALMVAKAGAVGAAGAAVLGAKLVSLASDAEETASKFKIVFGKEAKAATKELNAFSRATGTSKFALREQAAQMQALIKPMGVSGKAASGMSIGLTKLATDLASFNNSSVEEAMTALQSGLVGEAEPLRRFGVQLSAARVEAFAYAKGIAKQGEELTAAQKAQASYALILKDTALAQGDAERTSGSFANQFKRLKSQVTDIGTELGIKLLPAVTAAVEGITEFIQQMQEGQGAGERVAEVIRSVAEAFGSLPTPLKIATVALGTAAAAAAAGGLAFGPYGAAGAAAAVGIAAAAALIIAKWDSIRPVLERVRDVFVGSGSDMRAVGQAFANIGKAIAAVFTTVILPVVKRVLPGLVQYVQGGLRMLSGIVKVFAGVFTGDWRRAWDGVKQIVTGALKLIGGAIRAATAPIRATVAALWNGVKSLTSAGWNAVKSVVSGAVKRIVAVIKGYVGAYVAAGRALAHAVATGIRALVGALASAGRAIASAGVKAISALAGAALGAGQALARAAIKGVVSLISNASAAARSLGQAAVNGFRALIGEAYNVGRAIVQGLINGITSMAGDLLSKIGDLGGKVTGAFRSAFRIGSPSKVMFEMGAFVSEGLALGIESGTDRVIAATAGVIDAQLATAQKKLAKLQAQFAKEDAKRELRGIRGRLGSKDKGTRKQAQAELADFKRQQKRERQTGRIEREIARLEKDKARNAALAGIKGSLKDLATQAASNWRAGVEKGIDATLSGKLADTAVWLKKQLKDIAGSADSKTLGEIGKRQSAREDAQNERDLTKAQSRLERARAAGASPQRIEQLEAAVDEVQARILEKRVSAQEEAANAQAAAWDQAANDEADTNRKGLDKQESDLAASLKTQLSTLFGSLGERKLAYAEFVKQVQAILGPYGADFESSDEDAAAVDTGGGGKGKDKKKKKKKKKDKKKRAMGGIVTAGMDYTVGELGPELFRPNRSGRIIPNAEAQAAGGIVVQMPGAIFKNTADVHRFASQVVFKARAGQRG